MKTPDLTRTDPFQRLQVGWRMIHAYPTPPDGTCSCGCGEKLRGRQRRWHSKECGEAAYRLFAVHSGQSADIRWRLLARDGGVCAGCGAECGGRWGRWEADHIKPVQEGGGACGLDNFRTLCPGCHKKKTAEQAGRRAEARTQHSCPAQTELQY